MAEVIKISLVISTENNVYEYSRLLPSSYFDLQHTDLFSDEINSLREEVKQKHPKLKKFTEYIRVAAMDADTGKLLS